MPVKPEKPIRLDPRSPLVLDIQELGRRPGSMLTVRRAATATDDLGTDVIAVPKGSDLDLDLRMESVVEGVLVSGTVTATAAGQCVRCLDDLEREVEADVQHLYAYPGHVPADADDEDVDELVGDLVDIGPVVRDAIVLALPFQPVCREDCPGLCSECGAHLADDPGHEHEQVDPRWAALRSLTTDAVADDQHDAGPEKREN
jgi:uncharacterized protein